MSEKKETSSYSGTDRLNGQTAGDTRREDAPVLKIEHMSISFTQYDRGMHQTSLPVIRDLDVEVQAGEMVAVVGSSGSGKSLLAHGVMGVLPYNAAMGGRITYCGEELTKEQIGRAHV